MYAIIMSLLLIVLIIIILQRKIYQKQAELVLTMSCVFLLPLAFMSIVVMAPKVSIEDVTGILMLPHMNYLYIFLIVLVSDNLKAVWIECVWKYLSVLACAFITITLVMYTQIFQNCMEYELNKNYALGQRIISQLENLPQYSYGMKMAVGGRADNGNYPCNYPEMYNVVKGTAVSYGFFWDTFDGRQACWNQFLRQYFGVEYEQVGREELISIFASTEYEQMPIFPYEGSVRVINGTAVVKLSQ